MSLRKLSFLAAILAFATFSSAVLTAKTSKVSVKDLAPRYRAWLNDEVNYIISNDEKEAFLQLPTNEDREKFIEHFWELRNPTPGAPTNEYKDEIYRRIEYAKQWLRGIHTDMGRIYITLGEPKQRGKYYGRNEVRSMEIWFYQNTNPALPPYFSIVFFDKDNTGDMVLYSPYMDGPSKLATSVMTVNNNQSSFQAIDRVLGREVARTTLSLLPDEPVDIQNATATLQSDVMLGIIKNLPNHPLTKDMLNQRQFAENVTHRIVLNEEYLDVITVPLRDSHGNWNLHYLLRLHKPADFAIAQASSKFYYNVAVSARVYGPDNKLIFKHEKELSKYLEGGEVEKLKSSLFGYEGWLALSPGEYKIDFLLTNNITKTSYKAERKVTMPLPPTQGLRLSDVIAFSDAQAAGPESDYLPFSSGGVKFLPLSGDELTFVPGQNINIFYQIWTPAADAQAFQGKTISVDYGYGRMGGAGEAKTVHDQVAKDQFDQYGSMVSGKRIALTGAAPGNYRLVVSALDSDSQQKVFSSLAFRVYGMPNTPQPYDVYDGDLADDVSKGVPDFDRALTCLAHNDKDSALRWFKSALTKNPNNEIARSRVAELYFDKQDYADVAALFARNPITAETDEEAILRAAESMAKTGDTPRAIAFLEGALHMRSSSGPLYLALANFYRGAGNVQKANEMESKGRELVKR
jgi:GWxTD domain-containing protein